MNWTVLNKALREGQWGSGDVSPRILNRGSGKRCVISASLPRTLPLEEVPDTN